MQRDVDNQRSDHGKKFQSFRHSCFPAQRGRFVVVGAQGDASQASSARDRLLKNPAYQRLKQSSWKDSYKPAKESKPPGPIPQHLLDSLGNDSKNANGNSVPTHRDMQSQGTGTVRTISSKPKGEQGGSDRRPPNSFQSSNGPGPRGAIEQSQALTPEKRRNFSSWQHGRMTRVKFSLRYHAEFGQRLRMVGSLEPIGKWVLSRGVELTWSPGDQWTSIVELPSGSILEYKYVLLQSDGVNAISWQNGNNNVLAVGHGDDDVEVFDNWESAPGASVVAAGETSTREGRLLNWANEIESLFASQRADLRKSRMELVTAQDEARMARDEARRFQAELKASEAARAKAEMTVKELTISGSMLRTQLAETNRSFQKAIETTHKLLKEAQAEKLKQAESSSRRVKEDFHADDLPAESIIQNVENIIQETESSLQEAESSMQSQFEEPSISGLASLNEVEENHLEAPEEELQRRITESAEPSSSHSSSDTVQQLYSEVSNGAESIVGESMSPSITSGLDDGALADVGSENYAPASVMIAPSMDYEPYEPHEDELSHHSNGVVDFSHSQNGIIEDFSHEEEHEHEHEIEPDPIYTAQPHTNSSSSSSDLERLWEALARQSQEDQEIWNLPPETTALFPKAMDKLLVREAYDHLYEAILERKSRRVKKSRDILVRGSTGMGKSYWLLHLLGKLAEKSTTVVFESITRPDLAFLFSGDCCAEGSLSDFKAELDDKSTVYIVDGKKPKPCQALTVLLCSPQQASNIELASREIYVIPPWSFQELEAALPLFPEVSYDTLVRRYGQWGGSVKWCLEKANHPDNDSHLSKIITECTIETFNASFGERRHSQVSDELVYHWSKPGQALFSRFEIASKHISDHILAQLSKEGMEECSQFLLNHFDLSSSYKPSAPVFRSLLESWTAMTFCQNCSLVARYPLSGDLKVTSLEECPRREFHELSEVEENEDTAVWRPVSDAFQTVAFIRQPSDVVHMAFDNRPPELMAKTVNQCLEALSNAKKDLPVNLTCVMPASLYEIRRKMPLKGILSNSRLTVKQRFIKIPLRLQALPSQQKYYQRHDTRSQCLQTF